jgi:hypothetical protein
MRVPVVGYDFCLWSSGIRKTLMEDGNGGVSDRVSCGTVSWVVSFCMHDDNLRVYGIERNGCMYAI